MKVKTIIIISLIFVLAIVVLLICLQVQSCNEKHRRTPPVTPQNLNIKNVTATEIELIWEDSNNELAYQIYRDGQMIKELQKDSTKYIDYRLKPATLYEYKVVAVNNAGKTGSETITVKTKNPPIVVRLDKIGVSDNGEEYFRELIDEHGEIFIGVVVSDGRTTVSHRLPNKNYYKLADNSDIIQNIILFSIPEIGDYLYINIIGFENDGGMGEELLAKAFDIGVKSYSGGLGSAIMKLIDVDFSGIFKEIIGFEDDFLGEYTEQWEYSDNWGIGQSIYHECGIGNGTIGLKLWFTISSPIKE